MARKQSPTPTQDRRPASRPAQHERGRPETDPRHHLWRNGRLWWIAFTVHLPGWRKERVRLSLGTDDLAEAQRRRDAVLRHYPHTRGCALSLRIVPRRKRPRSPGRSPSRHPAFDWASNPGQIEAVA